MSESQRYPLMLHHPNEQPAVISDDQARGPMNVGYSAKPGQSRMFPPVTVDNADQEAYHVSRGYEPGPSAMPAAVAALPENYSYQQYPVMVDGVLVQDPTFVPVDNQYPKWVDRPGSEQVLVKSAKEEADILASLPPVEELEPVMSEVDRQFLAAMDAAAVPAPHVEMSTVVPAEGQPKKTGERVARPGYGR